ncbi:hypothetical protein [Paracoccus zhejiangensis]|uniref:Uncharacterized protein n=1 Tax=Paracoccus zhejiangensis TaxID=1077935 RepID=A0A2H5F3X7_9RHOB|nr:hypothetical protein [Paracoccus zhejiangensis]AUH66250.1 hypothetical protein CX676_08550 [Paracoccus zhejiangensis]
MSGLSSSPRLIRAGLVLMAPDTGAVSRIIALQYAPETLTREVKAQAIADGQNRSQALRLTGPASETISLDAVIDATDQLEFPDRNPDAARLGIFPALAALETLLYPTSAQLERQKAQGAAGSFEITPAETPLALFVWSAQRIVPVRLDSLQITEEFFDPNLNPIRAKLSLSMKVLSVDDLGFTHRGSGLFMAYLQAKEQLAAKAQAGTLDALGAGGLR